MRVEVTAIPVEGNRVSVEVVNVLDRNILAKVVVPRAALGHFLAMFAEGQMPDVTAFH